ncbi:ABC transporter permease [uncultured Muribaculum sp.]|uniref:ABC transporter permease n=1 Tax=uncultured Muribaculum sp. TaxID=1918613 RepID=UPI0026746F5C|nr:FtsX-like permease family protein [uncultured Muribaculum sp.]
MNKYLLKQIFKQWRENIWLIAELFVVSVVLWYVADSLFVSVKLTSMPLGYNTEHCYLVSYDQIDSSSPLYKGNIENNEQSLSLLLDKFKQRPEVEAACVVLYNQYPYGNNYNNAPIGYYNDHDSLKNCGRVYTQYATSQFPKVFRIYGTNGETPEELADKLKQNHILISDSIFSGYGATASQFIGKRVNFENESKILGATVPPYRSNTYKQPFEWAIQNIGIKPGTSNIVIRIRPEMDNNIVKSLLYDKHNLNIGTQIITSIQPFADIKYNNELYSRLESRKFIITALFLLVNIFLGLLGIFWFRTQQRTSEIAIRKATGATNRQILIRIISEGLTLLSIATIPAIMLDLALAHFELIKPEFEFISWERTLVCISLTYLIMAVIIVAGTIFPAVKAMRINPAIALKEE